MGILENKGWEESVVEGMVCMGYFLGLLLEGFVGGVLKSFWMFLC